jgi:hypothetical protein
MFQSLMDKGGFAEQGTQLPAVQAWPMTVPQPVKAAESAPAAAQQPPSPMPVPSVENPDEFVQRKAAVRLPENDDSSLSSSSDNNDRPNGGRSRGNTFDPPSDSNSDSEFGGRYNNNRNREKITPTRPKGGGNLKLKWKYAILIMDKDSYLKESTNWKIWNAIINAYLMNLKFTWKNEKRFSLRDQFRIASLIWSTYKRNFLDLINGVNKGIRILKVFKKTYASSDQEHRITITRELLEYVYDGKCPVSFVSKFTTLVRTLRNAGNNMDDDMAQIMFFTNTEKKAYGWTKRQQGLLKTIKLLFRQILDSFTNEFRHKIGQ